MVSRAVVWIAAGFIALALPFFILVAGERIAGGSLLFDFSMGLGFAALALFSIQFALTARFRPLTLPFGIDIVYLFHRYLAIGATALMLLHFAILYFWFQDILGELNPLEARWELTAGRVALGAFLLLIVTSELRKHIRLEYELWRIIHVGLAVIGFAAAIAHVLGVGRFTSANETRILWLGVTLGWLALILWVRIGKPLLQLRNPWQVVSNTERRGGVHSLEFAPLGSPLRQWKPGQFVWITLGDSPFGVREHPFTISTAPEHGPNVTVSIKPLGDYTEKIVHARPGARAYLDGPYGVFSIDNHPEAQGFVMIAGGVGITPMMANLHALKARNDTREIVMLYANRRLEEVAFFDELEHLEGGLHLKLVHVLEHPPQDWDGESGFIDREVLERHLPANPANWHFMMCGPKPMTENVRKDLEALGVGLNQIETEIFDMV